MSYPLTLVSCSISTLDSALAKTDKSKSMHHLLKDVESVASPQRKDKLTIHDGNAFFYYPKEVPPTFGQISSKLFDMMPVDCDSVFGTDIYYQYFVKSSEHSRRGVGPKLIIGGPKTKKPPDRKKFLCNNDNKQSFTQLL